MSYLEIGGNRVPVEPGDGHIGSDDSSKIVVKGEGVAPSHAFISATADGQVSVRIVDESTPVTINGVPLGPQPHPLLHGDKIGLGSQELLFAEETTSGSTQYVSAVDAAKLAEMATSRPKPSRPGQATAATGGRLVCLTDGREYTVGDSLRFGREAGNEVVVASKNVSRKHAEIVVTPEGYLLIDTSTNGTLINGERVQGQRLLARADVIRVGEDEFRFYADVSREPQAAAPSPTPAAPAPPPPAPEAPAAGGHQLRNTMHGLPPEVAAASETPAPPAPGADHRLNDTLHGMPPGAVPGAAPPTPPPSPTPPAPPPAATPPAPAASAPEPARRRSDPGVLAKIVVRSGSLMGQRLPVRVPIVNIGRADYNDIVLPEESVSTIHAKLQRREGIWYLVDLDSTNGSFVDGERVVDEVPLAPGAVVRFGEVKTFFEPTDDTLDPAKGSSTKMISAIKLPPNPPGQG